jgi:hypothetical protein
MIRTPRRRQRPLIARGALLALLVATPAVAQDTGTISGTIVDSSAQLVPGATVTLTNDNTADARTIVSNERGEFAFRALPPGSYTVRIELAGFKSVEQRSNILNASSTLDLGRLTMDVGERAVQLRCEVYNLFNQVPFQDIDRTARFDATGAQTNTNFGTAIGVANPTRPPRTVQLSARFNF